MTAPAQIAAELRRAERAGLMDAHTRRWLAAAADTLAEALLSGAWDVASMTARVEAAVRPTGQWCAELARSAHQAYPRPPRHQNRELARFLLACAPLPQAVIAARERNTPLPTLARPQVAANRMRDLRWDVPVWSTSAEAARHCGLSLRELEWFADVRGLAVTASTEGVRHYRYRWLAKSGGGVRLVESPKWQLRELQRRILREVLDRIPPHEAAHGFRRGRGILTGTAEHAGRRFVLRMDIENFFAAVGAGRVWGLLRLAGYPEPVAHTLTGVLTSTAPRWARDELRRSPDAAQRRLGAWLAVPHLPTGAPTSPALANLTAYSLDRRLDRLAESAGLRYTRYADDLAFSGDHVLAAERLVTLVGAIAADEGFRINAAKTRLMGAGGRQRLLGIVVNRRPNIARVDFDRLKATLHNAVVSGPVSQNRDGRRHFQAHLLGEVAWVESVNPAKGARLRRIYDQIDWGDQSAGAGGPIG